eukprot:TRINITY_DN1120_c0_g1_i1.p1 TRINITY_DN1120_c0_g1~~TRINITY_DN1120_c0_g1_i1.p1  ORF type:complete len:174 (+),score=30.55 TRINITY_DN1120_c0_g1_i1:42-563(+)
MVTTIPSILLLVFVCLVLPAFADPENDSAKELMDRLGNVTIARLNSEIVSCNSSIGVATLRLDYQQLLCFFTTAGLIPVSDQGSYSQSLMCGINKAALVPLNRMSVSHINGTSVSVVIKELDDAGTTLWIIVGVIIGVFLIVVVIGLNEMRKSKQRQREAYAVQEDERRPFNV